MHNLQIDVLNEQDTVSIETDKIAETFKNIANYALAQEEIFSQSVLNKINLNDKNLLIDVLICDDKKIHNLNKNYRNKDRATDVLTFAIFADCPDIRFMMSADISLGSIVISVDTTTLQAKEHNKTFEDEFYFLFSHGLLHLLGFDHQDENSFEFMMKKQEEMITKGIK